MRLAIVSGFSFRKREAEAHVLRHIHVRIERIGLEHHGDVAIARGHVIDPPVADADFAAGRLFQSGDGPQQGRLAAAGRSDQHDEFAVGDRQVDAREHVHRPEDLAHIAQRHRGHGIIP